MTDKPIPPINEFLQSFLSKEWTTEQQEPTPEEKEFARFCRKEEDEFEFVAGLAERIYSQTQYVGYDPHNAWLAAQHYHTFYTTKNKELKDRINKKKAELNIPKTSYYYNDYND